MNDIQVFSNPEFGKMRSVVIDGEPWFVGKDVAIALGYENHKDALQKHVEDEDKMGSQIATPSITDNMGRVQHPTWINESGLYALIFGSKLPSAKRFKRWVTSEVLPAIRKTGSYSFRKTGNKPKETTRPFTLDDCCKIAQILSLCKDERPFAFALLDKAGFSEVRSLTIEESATDDLYDEFLKLIRRKTVKDWAAVLPWSRTTIYYWKNEMCKPKCLDFTIEALRKVLDEKD